MRVWLVQYIAVLLDMSMFCHSQTSHRLSGIPTGAVLYWNNGRRRENEVTLHTRTVVLRFSCRPSEDNSSTKREAGRRTLLQGRRPSSTTPPPPPASPPYLPPCTVTTTAARRQKESTGHHLHFSCASPAAVVGRHGINTEISRSRRADNVYRISCICYNQEL